MPSLPNPTGDPPVPEPSSPQPSSLDFEERPTAPAEADVLFLSSPKDLAAPEQALREEYTLSARLLLSFALLLILCPFFLNLTNFRLSGDGGFLRMFFARPGRG